MKQEMIIAILEGYSRLDKLVKQTDKKVLDIALKSGGHGSGYPSTMRDIELINYYTNRKINLINLKIIVCKMLDSLTPKLRNLAKMRYINRLNVKTTAERLNISVRTVFRHCNRLAEQCMTRFFAKYPNYIEILEDIFHQEKWLSVLAERIKKSKETRTLVKSIPLNISSHKINAANA